MSEAEIHILRARLDGGIRNKAARGELRKELPVGLVWGQAEGEILLHPDESVRGVIAAVFEQFTVCRSARGVWLWLREHGLKFPLPHNRFDSFTEPMRWVEPTYHAVHKVLTHPAYAGAYVFGKTRYERYLGEDGAMRVRRRKLPRDQWQVLIKDHHPGYLDWDTYQANQTAIATNTRPQAHKPGTGAVREGCAWLQGLATCGICGRKLAVFYEGPTKATPGYYCTAGGLVNGRGVFHMRIGGLAIGQAVAEVFLATLAPAALHAALAAAQQLEDGHDSALAQWRREVERARYAAAKAERRYHAVDPDNRLVARGLETAWEQALRDQADAETELARREIARPTTLSDAERDAILALGNDLDQVWAAPSTTDRDRKQLLHTLLDEVNITLHRDADHNQANLILRWKGGAISELTVPLKRQQPKIRTDEGTVDLVRRLAVHYPDAVIAGILNRQGRRTPRGLSYTATRVQGLRHYWKIDCHQPDQQPQEGPVLTVADAAAQLGLAPSTCTGGWATGSSPANRSPPAPPGASA